MPYFCNFCTTLYIFDDSYSAEEISFAQQPLGTVRNGKQKIGIFPDEWSPIGVNETPKFRKGNFIVYRDSDGKPTQGFVESYNRKGANIKGNLHIPYKSITHYYETYSDYLKAIKDESTPILSRVAKSQSAYSMLQPEDRRNHMSPKDRGLVTGINQYGGATYDWPNYLGFDPKTVKPFEPRGNKMYRVGDLFGSNYSNKEHTYQKLAIPYIDNPEALKLCGINPVNYKRKINAIKDGNLVELNKLLSSNNQISKEKFEALMDAHNSYLKSVKESGLKVDPCDYGIVGTVAPWKEYEGGATQFKLPFSGNDLQKLEILTFRNVK